MPQAVLGLGSNIAPAKEHLDKAVEALSNLGTVKEVSPYILSKPEGFANQPDFVNAVVILSTPYPPAALLRKLKALEKQLGRTPTFKNGPRVIDLDILFYDQIYADYPPPAFTGKGICIKAAFVPAVRLYPPQTAQAGGAIIPGTYEA